MVLIPLPDYTKFSKNSSRFRETYFIHSEKASRTNRGHLGLSAQSLSIPRGQAANVRFSHPFNGQSAIAAYYPEEPAVNTAQRTVVEMIGLEPTTPALQTRCSPS